MGAELVQSLQCSRARKGHCLKLPPRPATLDSVAGHRSDYVEVRDFVCKAAKLSESPPRLVTAVGYLRGHSDGMIARLASQEQAV